MASLKIPKIIPVYKAGDSKLITNYRLISILSPFSKIFENIIPVRLNLYIDNNNILHENQFGFVAATDTYDGPANQVILLSQKTSMKCTHSKKSSGEIKSDDVMKSDGRVKSDGGVTWMFEAMISNAGRKTVYKNSSLRYNPEGRWSVTESGGTNELIITETRKEDAGLYKCIASTGQHTAQLVVLGKFRICSNANIATVFYLIQQ